jgi:hypothetical protein
MATARSAQNIRHRSFSVIGVVASRWRKARLLSQMRSKSKLLFIEEIVAESRTTYRPSGGVLTVVQIFPDSKVRHGEGAIASTRGAHAPQYYFFEFFGGSSRTNDHETSAVWPLS